MVFWCCLVVAPLMADSGIYICGYFNRSPEVAVPAMKQSGYTFGILFNINVEENGDLTYEGQTICHEGVFVLPETSPRFVDDVNSLIAGNTSLLRLEYCIGGWGNASYGRITQLVREQGTDENSILYRNFKALKRAIPAVIAINNDLEQDYEPESHAQFHIMLYDLGFKTTIAPYMNKDSYWVPFVRAVLEARPGAVDRNYLQCYGGGASNQPGDWNIEGVPVYGSYDIESGGFPKEEIMDRLTRWKEEAGIVGGFYWNYNDNRDAKSEAAAINEVFGDGEVDYRARRVAGFYTMENYHAPQTDFGIGAYTKQQIEERGIQPADVKAIKLVPGVKVTLYTGEDNTGDEFVITSDTSDVASVVGIAKINSWIVSADSVGELDAGEFCIRDKQSGLYLRPYDNMPTNGLSIRLEESDGTDYMQWRFEAQENGLYRIVNLGSGKTLQVANEELYEGEKFIQKIYSGREHQLFLIRRAEENGTYYFMALHSLKYVGLDEGDRQAGMLAVQQAEAMEWELVKPAASGQPIVSGDDWVSLRSQVVTGEVRLDVSDTVRDAGFVVCLSDLSGRVLMQDASGTMCWDVSDLQSGVYVLSVKSASRSTSFRLIKR